MDYIRYIEFNFVDVAQWKNLEKKEKIDGKHTYSDWYWKKA